MPDALEIIPADIATETTLQAIDAKVPTKGQKAMAASVPVAIAFDQQAIEVIGNVDIAGSVEITNDAGNAIPISAASLPLPTGAATQTTLAAILAAYKAEDSAAASGDLGLPLLGMRSSTDAVTTSDDGDYTLLKIDEEGRLKVSSKPASYADITGDITAVQATIGTPVAGGTVSGDVSRASNVMAFCTGTFSTINVTFEGSIEATGDTNWFGIQAVRSNANTIETATGNLSAAPAYAWEMSVNALKRVRVRCTARTSGTQSWRFVQGTYATEPIPAAQVSGTQPVSGTVTATVAAATLGVPATVADVASAAITGSANTAALTPSAGVSYQVNIPVTAVSGTSPTLDVRIEESDDTGTNWYTVYEFPRITGTGNYRSPMLPTRGNRIRYVQTLTGTSPSFTRAINRLQSNLAIDEPIRQAFDRTVSLTTLNAATTGLSVANCRNASLTINIGAATTPPALQLQGSDDNGGTWFDIGNPLTAVASSTVKAVVNGINCQLIRARVSTAGNTVVAGYVLVRGF